MLRTLLSELPGIWRRISIKLICVRMWNQPAKHFAPSQSWRQSEGSSAQCSHPWAATPGGSLGSTCPNSLEGHLILLAHPAEGGDLLGHLDDPLDGQVSQVDHAEERGSTDRANEESYLIRLGSLMYLRKSTSACWKTDWELNSWKTWSTGSAKEREAM